MLTQMKAIQGRVRTVHGSLVGLLVAAWQVGACGRDPATAVAPPPVPARGEQVRDDLKVDRVRDLQVAAEAQHHNPHLSILCKAQEEIN